MVLIIAKHFAYAGKEEFNFAMVEFEYVRFAKTGLSGSGRIKWSSDTLLSVSIAPWPVHMLDISLKIFLDMADIRALTNFCGHLS